jgi:hypothetical protein
MDGQEAGRSSSAWAAPLTQFRVEDTLPGVSPAKSERPVNFKTPMVV